MSNLTPEACRAVRAILQWSTRELAKRARIAKSTVYRFENDLGTHAESKAAMVEAFARHGVEITNGKGTGARLRRVKRQ